MFEDFWPRLLSEYGVLLAGMLGVIVVLWRDNLDLRHQLYAALSKDAALLKEQEENTRLLRELLLRRNT
jgi:hypothetical protein